MSTTDGPRKRRSPAEWQQLIEAWQASGLSQPAFCRTHAIALSTFRYWRRRLRDDRPSAASAGVIDLGALRSDSDHPTAEASGGWVFELLLGNWLRLHLRRA